MSPRERERKHHWWSGVRRRKGRKHHSWWPSMWVAADEYECQRCMMRAQIVPRRALIRLVVNGVELKKYATQKVYLLKQPGKRAWKPVLELPVCAGGPRV